MIRPDATSSLAATCAELFVIDWSRNNHPSSPMHRPIPAPEPDPEPNPEPDKDVRPRHGDIAPKDWNELFLAIQVRLEGCVSDALLKISDVELRDRRVVTQAVVMECIQAMQLLQAALTVERGEHVQGLDTAPASNRPKEYANVAASAP